MSCLVPNVNGTKVEELVLEHGTPQELGRRPVGGRRRGENDDNDGQPVSFLKDPTRPAPGVHGRKVE